MTVSVDLLNIVILYQWLIIPHSINEWELTLLSQYISIALLFNIIFKLVAEKSLLIRSLFAFFLIDAWCDVIKFALWQFSHYAIDLSFIGLICFIVWFIFILRRQYPDKIDLVNLDNVCLLILKPKTSFDVIKGLIGLPAASICILSHDYIWCFRRKSCVFEKTEYNKKILDTHLVVDTKVKCNDYSLYLLDELLGIKRFPCIKCVWTIRNVLNLLGGKYQIKTWFDYIPGIYFMRIL